MRLKIIYEDDDLLVADKPAGIDVIEMMDLFIKEDSDLKKVGEEPRYGLVHRLDKDTSGVILVAKHEKGLIFFQKQFKNRRVEKRYIALATGKVKNNQGVIETLIGRAPKDRKKQKVYLPTEPNSEGKREAVTEYKVIKRFKDYTLLEISPKTGRKHQIRCHFSYLKHPIVGDKMYGFKNQLRPEGLSRQFLHASYLKIKLPDGREKEFKSKLPEDLEICLQKLKPSTKPN